MSSRVSIRSDGRDDYLFLVRDDKEATLGYGMPNYDGNRPGRIWFDCGTHYYLYPAWECAMLGLEFLVHGTVNGSDTYIGVDSDYEGSDSDPKWGPNSIIWSYNG